MTEDEEKGIIIPPPDIKVVADLAADSVAKVGPGFENRLREKEQHNPKFCFLNPNDPYYKYFLQRIKLAQEKKVEPKKVVKPVAVQAPVVPVIPPPEFEYRLNVQISKQDYDIIKLTAQFVAKNGPTFLNQLSQKEQSNAQFDFLRPSHSFYSLFVKLVETYQKIINPSIDLLLKLKHNEFKQNVLERIMHRLDFEKYKMNEKQIQYQKEQDEKLAFQTVDWHDFVVVETIEFLEADDRAVLPVPLVLDELRAMTLEERKNLLKFENPKFKGGDEEDMDVDMELEDEEDQPEPVGPVQPKYIPKGREHKELEQICPRCNQSIKISEMQEHIRIELLNPQFQNQNQKAAATAQPTNLVSDNVLAQNLQRMTSYRAGDENLEKRIKFEDDKAQIENKQKVIWDGHKKSIPVVIQKQQQIITANAAAAASAPVKKPPPPPGPPKPPAPGQKQKLDNSISVTVNTPSGPVVYNDLTPLWTVSALKERIAKSTGMAVGKQKLTRGDYVLRNKETFLEGGVTDGCVLVLELKQRGGKK